MDQQETMGTSVRRANVFQNERGSSLFMEEVNCAWKGELQESYNDASMMSYLMEDTTELTLETKNVAVLSDPFGHPPDVSSIDIIPNVFSDFSAQGPNNQFLCVSTVGLEVSASCATSSPQLNVGAAPVFSNDASH
ncbi:hypothetical protein Tco_1052945, partial [Tanacetum coccineum]